MNKYLTLFCFVFLFSYTSLALQCTDDMPECSKENLQENQDKYLCVEVGEACKLMPYCSHAGIEEGDSSSVECSSYPVTDKTKYECVEDTTNEGKKCQEKEYTCKTVPNLAGIVCSSYSVEDSTTHYCGDAEPGSQNGCQEIPYCNHATEGDCSKFHVESAKSTTHVCVSGGSYCEEKYICDKVPKGGEVVTCLGLYIPDERKYKFECKPTEDSDPDDVKQYACKEVEFLCKDVPKFTGEGDAPISCSDFAVDEDKKATHICTEDTDSDTKQCKQINKPTQDQPDTPTESCNTIPKTDNRECKNIQASDDNHVCVDNTSGSTKCIEKLLCSKVSKPENNANSIDCSSTDYQISEANKNTHICVQDPDSQNYACKEEFLCNEATNAANDEECNKYPVVPAKKTTHVCIKDPTQNKCKEEFLCESVARGDSVQCSNYPVKIANKATHECIQSRNPEKACQEAKFCELNTEGTSDEQCRRYPITKENIGKKVCIKKEASGAMGCVEKDLCTTITKGTEVDCSKYPVSDEKMKNHICKAVDGNDKCSEVEISCLEATKGESDEQCSNYKVSDLDPNKKCSKNTDTSAGATPCTEISKSACELKTTGATDDVCNELAVSKTGEQICIKNPEGNNCLQLTYCEYGIGIDDYDCINYALKNKEKVCKKKADSNKCEEVEKTNEDDGGNNGGGNKGNKGSFLNLSFGLLLIISIL